MRVAERDLAVPVVLQPLIGEDHAIDVAGEIAHCVLPAPNRLDVYDPPPLPHGRIDRAREAGAGEGVSHLRAIDVREHVAGDEEARMRGPDPGRAVGGEATGGDEHVRVWMVP
jgi:hypothetical protein